MNSGARSQRDGRTRALLEGLPYTPLQHFALYFYAALLRVVARAASHHGSLAAARESLPFLTGYLEELQELGLGDIHSEDVCASWTDALLEWESDAPCPLPLIALRHAAALSVEDITLLVQVGLPDEDPRIGRVYDLLQGGVGERRITMPLLAASWPPDEGFDARAAVHRLSALGLVEGPSGDGGVIRPCSVVWDALRGSDAMSCSWMRFEAHDQLPEITGLVLPPALRDEALRAARVLESGAASVLVLRGPRHNGRSTLATAMAAEMGKGVLHVSAMETGADPRWRSAASVACLLGAAIVTSAEPGPSETFTLPDIPGGLAPLFVTLGTSGGLTGALADRTITLRVPVPRPAERELIWRTTLQGDDAGMSRRRLTSGNIVRAARLARASGALDADVSPSARARALCDAVRTLERPGLELLARRVDTASEWSRLAVSAETMAELTSLAARCRQRERLAAVVGPALGGMGPGVRALFKGPSGTGKTLAARLLAGMLGMDLYRVDLASVVNKYIGETEKNLERVFACAEELDVVLLFDEGDALLTQRTGVHSANDRYANLETNYLLQRFESYEGVLLVTTNAGDRIDAAFQRRMDVIVDFPLPDAGERWCIWQLHLPERHEVDDAFLDAAAQRCTLSGGEIRNVALHAALLALEAETPVSARHLEEAIEREYRRQGGQSPLRGRAASRGAWL